MAKVIKGRAATAAKSDKAAAAATKAASNARTATENTTDADAAKAAAAEAKAAAAAAKKAEAEVIAAKQAEHKVRVDNAVTELRQAAEHGALEVRAAWVSLGNVLITAKADLDTASKTVFGKWIKDAGIDAVCGDRNTRTDAMWLASLSPETAALIPSEGRAALANPKSIRKWYRDSLNTAYEAAVRYDVGQPKADAPADDIVSAGSAIAEAVSDYLDEMAEAPDATRAAIQNALDVVQTVPASELGMGYASFKEKAKPAQFTDLDVEAAAVYLLEKLKAHPEAALVFNSMVEKVETGYLAATDNSGAEDDAEDGAEDDDTEE